VEGCATRSRQEDALALLDEGGILLLCQHAHAKRARAALDRRADDEVRTLVRGGGARPMIFGHALYEHLAFGGPPVRGMAALVVCEELAAGIPRALGDADAGLAALLARPDNFMQPTGHGSLPLDSELLGM
jgi:hypothetical protein